MAHQPDFRQSADTRFLVQTLRTVPIGETITHGSLEHAIGKSIKRAAGALTSARRALLKEESIVFGTVRGVGLKRLADTEIVDTAAAVTSKIRRAARRGVRTLAAVSDFDRLTNAEKMRHSASMSILGTIGELSTNRSVKKVEALVENHRGELPIAQTLAAFIGR